MTDHADPERPPDIDLPASHDASASARDESGCGSALGTALMFLIAWPSAFFFFVVGSFSRIGCADGCTPERARRHPPLGPTLGWYGLAAAFAAAPLVFIWVSNAPKKR